MYFQVILKLVTPIVLKGDYSMALEAFFDAAQFALEKNLDRELGVVNVAIADVYSLDDNHNNAKTYYNRGINVLRSLNDSLGLASALLNAGDEYFNTNSNDTALIYFTESGQIFSDLKYELGEAYNLGNIGLVLAETGDPEIAEQKITEAVSILNRLGDFYPICVYYTYLSEIYNKKDLVDKSLEYAYQSLELAKSHGLKQEISNAHKQLSKVYFDRK